MTNQMMAVVREEAQGSADREHRVSELYREHWTGLLRLAVLMLDDLESAEDVVQESFGDLWRAWDRLDDRTKAVPYLRKAVLNRSRSMLRRRQVARLHLPAIARRTDSAQPGPDLGEGHSEVHHAIMELPVRMRAVLVLRFYLDLPFSEIAQALGISDASARATASRAIARLSRQLKDLR